jgi:hypothetical protein
MGNREFREWLKKEIKSYALNLLDKGIIRIAERRGFVIRRKTMAETIKEASKCHDKIARVHMAKNTAFNQ